MSTRRVTDESDRTVFRSDRFFAVDGKWFFSTREATTMGPYDRRAQAEAALNEYIQLRTGKNLGWNVPGATH